MIEIKCPNCGCGDAEILDYSDDDFDANYELWEWLRCEECDCEYDVKYVAVEIKQRDECEDM